MKNFEKYEKKLKEIINDDENIAYDKRTNEMNSYSEVLYKQCLFRYSPRNTISCTSKAFQWLYEDYVSELKKILTDKEKQYLWNVIEPFIINHDITIQKQYIENDDAYCITINLKHKMFGSLYIINLPLFIKDSHMYKGMDVSKIYKAEELGLLDNPTKI